MTMFEKNRIANMAINLIFALDRCDDEEFVNTVTGCISCNDEVTLLEIAAELEGCDEEEEW